MENNNSNKIKEMFNAISPKYVFMNKLMTFGQDSKWRKELIKIAELKNDDKLLDVATGTGDVIIAALATGVTLEKCTGFDFSPGMLTVARARFNKLSKNKADKYRDSQKVEWLEGDALQLPFNDNEFDVVTSAYLMRNSGNVNNALREQYRVLKPGGRVACLDTSPPAKSLISPFINFYLLIVIPLLGAIVAGSKSAYTYLPVTTKDFKTADELKDLMTITGFVRVSYKKYMFGTIAIHWGEKKREENE